MYISVFFAGIQTGRSPLRPLFRSNGKGRRSNTRRDTTCSIRNSGMRTAILMWDFPSSFFLVSSNMFRSFHIRLCSDTFSIWCASFWKRKLRLIRIRVAVSPFHILSHPSTGERVCEMENHNVVNVYHEETATHFPHTSEILNHNIVIVGGLSSEASARKFDWEELLISPTLE